MGGANVGCGEDGEEGDAGNSGLDGCATALFAVDEAEDSSDVHSGFACGFDGGDGGAASSAYVIDDDDVSTGFQEAFDFAAGAVSFFCFADEEALDEGGGGFVRRGVFVQLEDARELEDLVVVGESPCASTGGVGDEGVGSHGEAADGFCMGDVLANEVVEDETGEAAAFGVEGSDATVDVVVGLFAAGEGEVSKLEGEGGDQVEESGFVVSVHGILFDYRFVGGYPPILLPWRKSLRIIHLRDGWICKIVQTKDLRPKMCKQRTYGQQEMLSPVFAIYFSPI